MFTLRVVRRQTARGPCVLSEAYHLEAFNSGDMLLVLYIEVLFYAKLVDNYISLKYPR